MCELTVVVGIAYRAGCLEFVGPAQNIKDLKERISERSLGETTLEEEPTKPAKLRLLLALKSADAKKKLAEIRPRLNEELALQLNITFDWAEVDEALNE